MSSDAEPMSSALLAPLPAALTRADLIVTRTSSDDGGPFRAAGLERVEVRPRPGTVRRWQPALLLFSAAMAMAFTVGTSSWVGMLYAVMWIVINLATANALRSSRNHLVIDGDVLDAYDWSTRTRRQVPLDRVRAVRTGHRRPGDGEAWLDVRDDILVFWRGRPDVVQELITLVQAAANRAWATHVQRQLVAGDEPSAGGRSAP